MPRRPALHLATMLLAAATIAAGCVDDAEPSATPPTDAPVGARLPVIIDTDIGLDDIGALLVLLRDPAVDVRAITISGTGIAHCQGGRLVVRYLIDEMGVPDIPFGCGREKGGPDARPFPESWRAGPDAGFGYDITPQVESGTPRDAAELIVQAVADSPSAPTIVALGPWTNLEDAFALDPGVPDRLAGIHAMIGTLDAPGNVMLDEVTYDDPVEWNAFADPSSIAPVLETDVPITIVPLDATDDVPVPTDLGTRLDEDRVAGGADLMYELVVRNPFLLDPTQGNFLWDELAALTLTDPSLASWEDASIVVGPRGELIRDDDAGRPIRYASEGDRAAFEAALLDAWRRGEPRTTPFRIAGKLRATFDGTTCTVEADVAGPGVADVTFTGTGDGPTGVMIVGTGASNTWPDVEAFLATVDLEATESPPPWILLGGQIVDESGTGGLRSGTANLEPGTYGPVCIAGEWPDLTFITGTPFDVPAAS